MLQTADIENRQKTKLHEQYYMRIYYMGSCLKISVRAYIFIVKGSIVVCMNMPTSNPDVLFTAL